MSLLEDVYENIVYTNTRTETSGFWFWKKTKTYTETYVRREKVVDNSRRRADARKAAS